MFARGARLYHHCVHRSGPSASRALTACAFFMFAGAAGLHGAVAATTSYDVGDQSIVRLFVRSATVTIKTWERNTVAIEWTDGDPIVPFKGTQLVASATVPILAQQVREFLTAAGPVNVTLPPEDFPISGFALGLHDIVRVQEVPPPAGIDRAPTELSHVTLTVPASTRVLELRVGRGDVTLSDYHGTTIAFTNAQTTVNFVRVGGDAFVQPLNGHFYAVDSNFNRLRVRSNHADLVFERCHIREVEATSLTGNIVYDNGTFETGLAHFESDRGNVALWISSAATVSGHTQDGHVFSMQNGRAPASSTNDANATFGTGGPSVSASSTHRNVFFYDGSIADRRPLTLVAPWRSVYAALMSKRRATVGNAAMPKPPPALSPAGRPIDRRPRLR